MNIGDKYKLPKFISEHHEQLMRKFQRLTEGQRKKYASNLVELRAKKQAIVRANPKAVLKDFDAAFSVMEDEVSPWQINCPASTDTSALTVDRTD